MPRILAIFLTIFLFLTGEAFSREQDFSSASDQITSLTAGNITATTQRDGAGNITGYVWANPANPAATVTQTWTRGVGGRINAATNNVPGAPTFTYLIDANNPASSFDARNRRLKATTQGGTWTYAYNNGQLTSAIHPTLGTFSYNFDGIGRRTDKGTANTSDILNRTTAWTNIQQKNLTINAWPTARVWYNGTEIPNFTGQATRALPIPGPNGGWVPWK